MTIVERMPEDFLDVLSERQIASNPDLTREPRLSKKPDLSLRSFQLSEAESKVEPPIIDERFKD